MNLFKCLVIFLLSSEKLGHVDSMIAQIEAAIGGGSLVNQALLNLDRLQRMLDSLLELVVSRFSKIGVEARASCN